MTPRTRVKERAEEQSSSMSDDQQAVIRMVANDLHRLNQSVMKAVEAGVFRRQAAVEHCRDHRAEPQPLAPADGLVAGHPDREGE